MRYLFTIFLAFGILSSAEAQHVEVKYKRVVIPEINFGKRWKPSAERKRKMLQQMEDKNYNEYMYFTLISDGKSSSFVHDTTFNLSNDDKKDDGRFGWWNMEEIHPIMVKNFKENAYYNIAPEELESDLCMVDSLINKSQWVIGNDQKVFADLLCRNAYYINEKEDTIKAWYAPRLPISDGPMRYSGLPGLIMAIEDNNIHLIAEEVKIHNSKIEIGTPKHDCLDPSEYEEEYRKIVTSYYINKKN